MTLEIARRDEHQQGTGSVHGASLIVVDGQGRIERGDQGVADMVDDDATMPIDDLRRRAEEAVQHPDDLRRRQGFGEARESFDIGKDQTCFAGLR